MTLVTPNSSLSVASISPLVMPGLRFSFSRHSSVVISVPSPSMITAPPSRIMSTGLAGMSSAAQASAAKASSFSHGGNLPPQQLNRQSSPIRSPAR